MKTRKIRHAAIAVALGCMYATLAGPTPAHAGVVGSGGGASLFGAPGSVELNAWQNNSLISVFQEQNNFTLEKRVGVDAWVSGTYGSPQQLDRLWIPRGATVNSYFVHQDTFMEDGRMTLTGSLTFEEEILGVMVRNRTLNRFDPILRSLQTIYPAEPKLRGLELSPNREWFTLSEDLRTITFNLTTYRAMDQMRILTMAVPAPSAGLLLAAGGLVARRRRRR